jgi:hypothetical protein
VYTLSLMFEVTDQPNEIVGQSCSKGDLLVESFRVFVDSKCFRYIEDLKLHYTLLLDASSSTVVIRVSPCSYMYTDFSC